MASIWAQDQNGVIGDGSSMLWSVPADLAHFKQATWGDPVIMGRASFEALGGALPGRPNIVVTRNPDYEAPGAQVATTLQGAVALAQKLATQVGSTTVWITGGGTIYQQTMGMVDEVVLTQLDLTLPGDAEDLVHAPDLDGSVWRVDPARSDMAWRPQSGDARWRVITYVRDH